MPITAEQVAAAAQVENEFINRVESEIDEPPEVRTLAIDGLLELLLELLANACGGDDVTPEQAIKRVKRLSRGERAVLRSKLTKRMAAKGVRNAREVSVKTADATEKVAKASTDAEQLAFADYVKTLTDDSYVWI